MTGKEDKCVRRKGAAVVYTVVFVVVRVIQVGVFCSIILHV